MRCPNCGRSGEPEHVAILTGATNERSRRRVQTRVTWAKCRNRRCQHGWYTSDPGALAVADDLKAREPAAPAS